MAFELQESKESSPDFEAIVGVEEFTIYGSSFVHSSSSRFDDIEKEIRKSSQVSDNPRISLSKEGSVIADGYTIIDLPHALVFEILRHLDAKELCVAACVCTLFRRFISEHCVWKEFYCERWGLPSSFSVPGFAYSNRDQPWKDLYVEREFRTKVFMGRYSMDMLYGHKEAVRAIFVLVSAKLVFTSGYDSVVRIWDLEEGLPLASSKQLECTIRTIVADDKLLIAAGTDTFLHCWTASEGTPHLFDVEGCLKNVSEFRLRGHDGPVSCLSLDAQRIYSGSWDMTVRVWNRSKRKCIKLLRHSDWVWSLVPRGSTVAVTSGCDIYLWDIEEGGILTIVENTHSGNIYASARSYTGDILFTGGEDGVIHMFEVLCVRQENKQPVEDCIKRVASWIPHTGAVNSLAFEFPWLVACSDDGKMSLIDVRKLLRSKRGVTHKYRSTVPGTFEPPQRMLTGFGCNLFSVGIGMDRLVCAGEEGIVRIWDFSQALEIERRALALRRSRLENRMRRCKTQLENNSKGKQVEQCSVQAKKNPMHGGQSRGWVRRKPLIKVRA